MKCTSLVETVISAIVVEMYQDNSIQDLFDSYTALTGDLSCTGVPTVVVPSVTLELAGAVRCCYINFVYYTCVHVCVSHMHVLCQFALVLMM